MWEEHKKIDLVDDILVALSTAQNPVSQSNTFRNFNMIIFKMETIVKLIG